MMKNQLRLIVLIVVNIFGTESFAQTELRNIISLSPTLQLLLNTVNYYAGVPDISASWFTIQSGGLTLPISLSYHEGANANQLTKDRFNPIKMNKLLLGRSKD